jgi:phage terminase small subunit
MTSRPHDGGDILPIRAAQGRATRVVAGGEPLKPRRLPSDVARVWDEIVPGLVALGVVAEIDTTYLVMLCEWRALYRRYMAQLAKLKDGDKRVAQLTTLAAIAQDKADKIGAKFGLSPKDRDKLRVPQKQDDGGVMARRRS